MWWGPRYGGYGGCFGSILGVILLPLILFCVLANAFFDNAQTSFANIWNGGTVEYDEVVMQEYGEERYSEIFANSAEYEENIMIVFLINDKRDGYYVYACVGDDLEKDTRNLFGDETTYFGRTVLSTVNEEYYGKSLSSNLADVVDEMQLNVTQADKFLKSGKKYSNTAENSKLINNTELEMNKDTVNKQLEEFTDETGIGIAYTVEDMEEVFGKKIRFNDILMALIAVSIVVVTVILIIKRFKEKSKEFGYTDGDTPPDDDGDRSDDNGDDSGDDSGDDGGDDGGDDRKREEKKRKKNDRDRYNRDYKKGNYNKHY